MGQAGSEILIISGVKGDTRRYRAFHLEEQLRLAGFSVAAAHQTDPGLEALVGSARVIVFQRVVYDRRVDGLFRRIRESGGLPILDTDDLTFDQQAFRWIDSPDFKDSIRMRLYQENMDRNRQTLEQCPAALTSTRYLAERIRGLGHPAWVHRNAYSLEMGRLSEDAVRSAHKAIDRVVLGYASGTPTHNRDFALIRGPLLRTMQRHPAAELWLLGPLDAGPGWESVQDRIRRIAWVPWRGLPALLAQLDVNLAPLRLDNPFSQSKSEIKWMEAGLVGVPTIASPTDAFQTAVRSGENGFLASTESDWEVSLERLLTDSACRAALGRQAQIDVQREYAPPVRAAQAVRALEEMLAARGESLPAALPANSVPPPTPANPEREAQPGLLRRGLYELRYRGLLYLLGQIWVFFRRLAAPIIPF